MQSAQTAIVLHPVQSDSSAHQVLRLRSQNPSEKTVEQSDFQPVIERLRVIYLQHINCDDDLSLKIQEVAGKFIQIDSSEIIDARDIIRIAQNCRNEFTKILCNDLDRAPLEELVVIRDWKFEKWQLLDYVMLDKFFGQRQIALSPFDQQPIPDKLPRHEFAEAIIELIKTIPNFIQESNTAPLPAEQQQALVTIPTIQSLVPFTISNSGDGTVVRQVVESFTPETNFIAAWQRYDMWKRMGRASIQERKHKECLVQLKIDIAARKLANENYLQEIITQEAQRMLAYCEARQQETQAYLEEVEEARVEIANLSRQLDEAAKNLKKLREDLTIQEKKSDGLQQQIYVEQAKYARLAQEIQEIRNRCKKKPWWKIW